MKIGNQKPEIRMAISLLPCARNVLFLISNFGFLIYTPAPTMPEMMK